MGVEIVKDRFGEDQLVLSNDDFYNDDVMGDKFSDYKIIQILRKDNKEYLAKVSSNNNYKIYILKRYDLEKSKINSEQEVINKEFQIYKNLNHQNIIKYYKCFKEGNNLYIVKEYAENGALENIKVAHNILEKPINEKTLWNIFMQCMSGLEYLHKEKLIHGNISPFNILMDENKVIKLDDMKMPFIPIDYEDKNSPYINKPNELNTDIYMMGLVFNTLISINDGKYRNSYSKEMINIVDSMINDYKNQTATSILNLIKEQYIKNAAKLSSINSIFRCLSTFQVFTFDFLSKQNGYLENYTPVAYYFIQCLINYFDKKDPKDANIFYNNFRNLLNKNNQINNDLEINPKQVLEFLFEKLNKETGNNINGPSFGIQSMKYESEKQKAIDELNKYINDSFNSMISKYFGIIIKDKIICTEKHAKYSFNIHPFIEFYTEMIKSYDKDPNIKNFEITKDNFANVSSWFILQHWRDITLTKDHKIICDQCKGIAEFYKFKQFYHLPKCLIISLNQGENYNNEFEPNIEKVLNLKNKLINLESNEKNYNYNLVGIIKRMIDSDSYEYFIAIYKDNKSNSWKISDRNNINDIEDPLSHKEGIVTTLFYSSVINISE